MLAKQDNASTCCDFALHLSYSKFLGFYKGFYKGVGKYDKSVEILKMLAAPPMGGKI